MSTEIESYRQAVLQAMLAAKDENGQPQLTEKEATEILNSFTDDELAFGIPFNTPEETAKMLMED